MSLFVEQALLPLITDRRYNVARQVGLSRVPGRPRRFATGDPTTDVEMLVVRAKAGDPNAAATLLRLYFEQAGRSIDVDQRLLRHFQRAVSRRIEDPKVSIATTLGIARLEAHRPRTGLTEAHIELRDMAALMVVDGMRMATIVRNLKRQFLAWSAVTIRDEVRVVRRFVRAVRSGLRNSRDAVGRQDAEVAREFDRRTPDELESLAQVRYEPDPLAAAFFNSSRKR